MNARPEETYMQFWKWQFDAALRTFETMAQGAMRVCEVQLEAATQAHADAEATRKALATTSDPSQLLQLQAAWARANLEKWLAYWRALAEACTGNVAPVERVYKQWFETWASAAGPRSSAR
jgi:phasin family protein